MSLRYIEDVALMQQNIPTATKGVESVVRYYKNATNELKNLLQNECDVIFECAYCKNLFRSIINFVTHKRTYCRSLSQSVTAMSTINQQANEFLSNGSMESPKVSEEREPRSSKSTGRSQYTLRRVNLNAAVNKHVEKIPVRVPNTNEYIELSALPRIAKPAPITSFKDGHQWVEEIPPKIAVKEHLPEDRVLLLMPQDKSIRYGEMQLRRRKDPNSQDTTREIKHAEAQMLEHLPESAKNLLDLGNFTCRHADCSKGNRTYPTVMVLVYHLCIKHSQDILTEEQGNDTEIDMYTCFLCQKQIKSIGLLHSHLISRHKQTHQTYLQCGGTVATSTTTLARKSTRNKNTKVDDLVNHVENTGNEEDEETAIKEHVEKEKTESSSIKEKIKFQRRSQSRPEEMLLDKKVVVEIDNSNIRNEVARELTVEQAEKIDKLLQSFKPSNTKTNEEKKLQEIKQEEDDVNTAVRQCVSNIKAIIAREDGESTREPTMSPRSEIEEKVNYSDDGSEIAHTSKPVIKDQAHSSSAQAQQRTKKFTGRRKIMTPKKIEIDSKSDSGSSLRNIDDDTTIEGDEIMDELLVANRPRRAARRPERFRDDDFITYSERKRNSDVVDLTSEGDSSNKPTPAKKNRRPDSVGQKKNEGSDTTTTVTPSPPAQSDAQLGEKSTDKKLRLDLTKLAKRRSSELLPKEEQREQDEINEKPKLFDNNSISGRESSQGPNKKDWVLPLPKKSILPVDNAVPQRQLDPKDYHEDLKFYTPRARRIREDEDESKTFSRAIRIREDDDEKSTLSRRKQVLPRETDDITILKAPGHIPPRPADLSEIPVYLTEVQRDIFFAPLKPLFTGKLDGNHQCSECGNVLRSIQEGRRHMVGHIRVVRLRCSLCDVGAFFCSDMRTHLMNRHCPNLHLAPSGFVKEGAPCMTRQQADGKIISADNPVPYRPDPRIEENILGPARPHYMSRSPKKSVINHHPPSADTPTSSSSTNLV